MRLVHTLMVTAISLAHANFVVAQTPTSWNAAKNSADDHVYYDHRMTFYCGCPFVSDEDDDGSGDVDPAACGLTPLEERPRTVNWIEWEHIVPASLMPARRFSCWTEPQQFETCIANDGDVMSGRACCERVSSTAQAMIFDLHNLAPSVGQLNQYRSNDRYGEVEDNYVSWIGCPARDQNGTRPDFSGQARFEPPDCVKGDVARVWQYMHDMHGVGIDDQEYQMFESWSARDPVTSWEQERDRRIDAVQGNSNAYVSRATACAGTDCCSVF